MRALSRGVSVARDAPEASGAWALGADDDVALGDRFAPRSIDAAALGLDNDTSAHVVSARDMPALRHSECALWPLLEVRVCGWRPKRVH